MTDTALILPCAGLASRFGAPWPKETAMIEPDYMLIDYSLEAARVAGCRQAFLVVPDLGLPGEGKTKKLQQLSALLGPERLGLRLTYVTLRDSDLAGEAGSVLRGCSRAASAYSYRSFAIAYPDVQLEETRSLSVLLDASGLRPGLWHPHHGMNGPALAVLDVAAVHRIRRLLVSGQEADFWPLAEADAKDNECWVHVESHAGAWDINEIDDMVDAGLRARSWR